ncbi:HNH endonuclease signature motif containing protein [Streptomyces sp. NPDC056291]|uniref:HNH endonuclease signature motif containing protein n=1 Tax=Streptomyces sp. NPDC056291 TaxID=3345772 RepID=UPI0035D95980
MSKSIYDFPDGRELALARLDARTDRSGLCWLWTGSTAAGYGKYKIRGVQLYAHRSSCEAHVGPIPGGLFILHSCDNRLCVKPEHLRPGTPLENMQDRDRRGRNGHSSKTHCRNGHRYTKANTQVKNGKRRCLTCKRAAAREWWRKNHGAGGAR